ncbi:MAG: UDP-N-acetylmuramate--L-alanine ligase [Candidatus Nanopelagicales bacterium]
MSDLALPALRRVHLVGMGGAGMSGLARLMIDRGVSVSGSDMRDSARLETLRRQGAQVYIGHAPEHVAADVDVLIDTPIIPDDNPEVAAARERGIPVLSRSEALALVMADRTVIGVGGTHGKTTTTSMITVALQRCGVDPSFAIGSEVNDLGSNAHTGQGEYFVVEADESDGAFLHMDPRAVVITNVEPDHLNHWGTFEALEAAFDEFADLVAPHDGVAVVCADQAGSRSLAERASRRGTRVVTYGTGDDADYRIEILGSHHAGYRFDVVHRGIRLGDIDLQVPGRHNALNATAALAVCDDLGFSTVEIRAGLQAFSGTRRRFEFRGEAAGVRVYDDYAHHPTELEATLSAAREFIGEGRLVVAFQAHHYYRTALFSKEFGQALGLADDVVVLEVFAPGEEPIPGASGQAMAANVPLPPGHVVFEPSWSKVAGHLAARARPGDMVMTLGAGDISLLGPEVLALLREEER